MFRVPLDDERVGLGQVVATYGEDAYYFALFEPAFKRQDEIDLGLASQSQVAILGLSLDAKIHAGHWQVVGNKPVAEGMPLPAFKEMVGGPDRVDVVDYSGARRRPASAEEAMLLPRRIIVAPVRLEKALRARHGLEPWVDKYSDLVPSPFATTEGVFGSP